MSYIKIAGKDGYVAINGIVITGSYNYSYYNLNFSSNLDSSLAKIYDDNNEKPIFQNSLYGQNIGTDGNTISDNNSDITLSQYKATAFSVDEIDSDAIITVVKLAAKTEASFAKLNKLVEFRQSYITKSELINLQSKIDTEKMILKGLVIDGDITGVLWPGSFSGSYNPIRKYGSMHGIVVDLT